MNRQIFFAAALVLVAAAASGAAVRVIQCGYPAGPQMSEEQRKTRETFFGASKELPPIDKGQEMRPRW